MIRIIFRGVRGSYAVVGSSFRRFGASSTCCEVLAGGRRLIIDAGSGIIPLGNEILSQGNREFSLLFTHYHIDHCYGMYYFKPIYQKDTEVAFIGPAFGNGSLKKNLEYVTNQLVHPVAVGMLPCRKHYIDIEGGEKLVYQDGKVRPYKRKRVNCPGDSLVVKTLYNKAHAQLGVINYRIEHQGKSFVFATDVECEPDMGYSRELAEFASGADLLAMDGQYTDEEYLLRKGWGHSTYKMACRTAEVAGVKELAIIHHDPEHNDKFLTSISREVKNDFKSAFLAREGQEIEL